MVSFVPKGEGGKGKKRKEEKGEKEQQLVCSTLAKERGGKGAKKRQEKGRGTFVGRGRKKGLSDLSECLLRPCGL